MRRARVLTIATAALAGIALATTTAHADVVADASTTIAGIDRYDTAAELSKEIFPGTVTTVYLATGENFPDALSAGPAAGAADGPVLLVQTSDLPNSTADELKRLEPDQVYVVGGVTAIDDTVIEDVEAIAEVGTVERIDGLTRYDTAIEVSETQFTGVPVPVVYVTTGENFPDALSAGAAAASLGGPVLLTEKSALPTGLAEELTRLSPIRTVIVGGTLAIDPAVETAIDGIVGDVERIDGATRWHTSANISADAFPDSVETVRAYVATGENFPDALAAGAVAAQAPKGPVLLMQRTCVQPVIDAEFTRLDATNGDADGDDLELWVLGGPLAIDPTVFSADDIKICA